MAVTEIRGETFRLHTDAAGVVWYGRDNLPALSSGEDPDGFVRRMAVPLRSAGVIRIVGSQQNARLIVVVQQLRQLKGISGRRLLLASPRAFGIGSATEILHRLWQPDLSCRVSASFHEMTQLDFASYLLADAVNTGTLTPEKSLRLISYHPVWVALSFIPTLHLESACRLITAIMDPRWFRHDDRPSRLSCLNAYLGLTPTNVHAYLKRKIEYFRYADRFAIVADCWFKRATRDLREDNPANFLFRIVSAARNPEMGMLRACEKLVRFVCETWLASLSKHYEFVPEMFFHSKEEIEAYKKHVVQAARAA